VTSKKEANRKAKRKELGLVDYFRRSLDKSWVKILDEKLQELRAAKRASTKGDDDE
jgi:hypothetical protein